MWRVVVKRVRLHNWAVIIPFHLLITLKSLMQALEQGVSEFPSCPRALEAADSMLIRIAWKDSSAGDGGRAHSRRW